MRYFVFISLWALLAQDGYANLPVKYKVELSCNVSSSHYTGCLRGMTCLDGESCVKPPVHQVVDFPRVSSRHLRQHLIPRSPRPQSNAVAEGAAVVPEKAPAAAVSGPVTTDGTCGRSFGNAVCGDWPLGSCCSSYGYCGGSPAHCGAGCQSGDCEATVNLTPGSDSQDGTCGAGNGDTVCGAWALGSCCSLYGFCGNTLSHCGDGCQSGPCNQAPKPLAPGPRPARLLPFPGEFNIVGQSGVPAMHAGLMPNGKVFFLDKVEDYSQVRLPNGQFAYSSEYDPSTNTYVPLAYQSNAFCSGGTFLADGRVVSLGGNAPLPDVDPTVGDGFDSIRYLSRSPNGNEDQQDWSEPGNKLSSARWYASAQTMPDGTIFVASGSLNGLDPTVKTNNNPTYEILNSEGVSNGNGITLDILDKNQPYYMYPFIHLMSDGNLFIFVAKSADIFNVASGQVIKTLPDLLGDYRTYPNTGGSVLLPLSSEDNWQPDILICGGGAYQDITSPTDASCGRIQPLSDNPTWELDAMPQGRGMVESLILPDGTVLWLNGCKQGAQGFGLGADPAMEILLYNYKWPIGQRWWSGASSTIPRLYHSVALLLLDGTVLVAGSNPVAQPILTPVPGQTPSEDYVTEFRVEIYTPPNLQYDPPRPSDIVLSSKTLHANGETFSISFNAPDGAQRCRIALYHGGFVTHSLHMGHRMLFLDEDGFLQGQQEQTITVTMPPNTNIAPPGPYVVYVVTDGTPGLGQFVMVS